MRGPDDPHEVRQSECVQVPETRVFMEFRMGLSIFSSEFRSNFTFFLRFWSNHLRQIELFCSKEIDFFLKSYKIDP